MRRHPSRLAYTSKGHAYSMTVLPRCSPSCPAPPSQLSRQLCTLQPPPCHGRGHRGRAWGHLPACRDTAIAMNPHRTGSLCRGSSEKTLSAPPCPHLPRKVKRAPWANSLTNLQVSLITLLMGDWDKLDLWVLKANCWALHFQDGAVCASIGVSEML